MGAEQQSENPENSDSQTEQNLDENAQTEATAESAQQQASSGESSAKVVRVQLDGQEIDIPSQFVTKDGKPDVTSLVKSVSDLRTKISSDGAAVSDNYTPPENINIDVENPLYQAMLGKAREHGVPAKAFEAMLGEYAALNDNSEDVAFLKKEWGEDFEERLRGVQDFWKGMLDQGTLPKASGEAFDLLSQSAAGVMFLDGLQDMLKETDVPSANDGQDAVGYSDATMADVLKIKRSKEYRANDPDTVARARKMAAAVDKNSRTVKKAKN